MQLCGSSPQWVAEAAKKAVDLGAAFIDVNMGCPAKGVVALGAGAALLKDPPLAASIVREVKRSVSVPVTAKIRAGWDDKYRNAIEIGPLLENEGIACLTVHARTREQQHRGEADWNLVAEMKKRLKIPVVGNGGIDTPEQVTQMMKETGCDGIMVARGALGNPWIFEGRRPSVREIRDTLLSHFDDHLAFYGNRTTALVTFRKHIVWYTRGLANAAEFRLRVFKEESLATMLDMIRNFFDAFEPTFIPWAEHAG
jgi:nifR3 family TIM-barrel protein